MHIDEIAEASRQNKGAPVKDAKNHPFAIDGFVYRTTYFQDFDGRYYKITFSVGLRSGVATIYNVGKIEKDQLPSAKLIAVVGSQPRGNSSLYDDSTTPSSKSQSPNSSKTADTDTYIADAVDSASSVTEVLKDYTGKRKLQQSVIERLADGTLKRVNSKYDSTELTSRLSALFDYITSPGETDWAGAEIRLRIIYDAMADGMGEGAGAP